MSKSQSTYRYCSKQLRYVRRNNTPREGLARALTARARTYMLQAANIFGINDLVDLFCKRVADAIARRTPNEILCYFNIKKDATCRTGLCGSCAAVFHEVNM